MVNDGAGTSGRGQLPGEHFREDRRVVDVGGGVRVVRRLLFLLVARQRLHPRQGI
jgi:hypothetical protein